MPMADIVIKQCDQCASEATHTVVLKEARRSDRQIDLCDTHYQPIDELRELGRTPQGAKTYRRYRKQDYQDR